jgi:hypothetical protein
MTLCNTSCNDCCSAVNAGCPGDDSLPGACSGAASYSQAQECISENAGRRRLLGRSAF